MDIRQHIAQCKYISPDCTLLVAVSGGPDSVVLLDALCALDFHCVVAHCNFHLRGEDSDGDERFVESVAKHYGVPFCKVGFDTVSVARSQNISIEMAARNLRYGWFEKMADEYGCDAIAVAHNANDVVETFFLNLVRGTGIAGLSGIAPKRGRVVRPMLDVPRVCIMDYIDRYHLQYRIDVTNSDTVYRRNKIRHELMPLLEEINPAIIATMLGNISNLRAAADIVGVYTEDFKSRCIQRSSDGFEYVDIALLEQCPGFGQLVYGWLGGYGFSSFQIRQVVACLDGVSGRRFVSSQATAVINRGRIELYRHDDTVCKDLYHVAVGTEEIFMPVHLVFDVITPDSMVLERNAGVAFFDLEKLPLQLLLRRWHDGDKMIPFGMNGRKKISDLLADAKMSVEQKRKVWLLLAGDDVLWTIGVRAGERYKVTESTRRVLRITCVR